MSGGGSGPEYSTDAATRVGCPFVAGAGCGFGANGFLFLALKALPVSLRPDFVTYGAKVPANHRPIASRLELLLLTPNFGDPSRPILRVKGEELAQAKEEVGDGALCLFHAVPPFAKQLPIFWKRQRL